MKKFNKIVLLLVCVLFCCIFAVACTENTKQKAVELDKQFPIVTSNGGTAVQYGNYVYFVNGYAGEAALNTFGSVNTGAICRVTLKKDGDKIVVDNDSFCVIAPKNVYGTDTTYPGIYISGDYIYYHTTSVDKNSKREYKTGEGVLMRTSLDGSETKIVKNFSDNATVFYVSKSYLVYAVKDSEGVTTLHGIKLSDLSEITIESESVTAYKFTENYVVYTINNGSSSDTTVKAFSMESGRIADILSTELYNGKKDGAYLFATSVKDVKEANGNLYVLYTKDDNSASDIYTGYYCAVFTIASAGATPAMSKEFRLSNEISTTSYDALYVLKDGSFMTYHEKNFSIFDKDGIRRPNTIDPEKYGAFIDYNISNAASIIGVYENESEVYAYYTASDAKLDDTTYTSINYIKLFNVKEDGSYEMAKENIKTFFYFNYKSTYTTYEVTDLYFYEKGNTTAAKAVFYLNSDLGDNAFSCYHILQGGNDRTDATEAEGKLLGNIEDKKLVDLISSGKIEEE